MLLLQKYKNCHNSLKHCSLLSLLQINYRPLTCGHNSKQAAMIATMERFPFTQLFQHSTATNQTAIAVCSPSVHSPTAAETYPSYHAMPHPVEDISYAATTSQSTVQSPSYQNHELIDPSGAIYHSSSAMMPISGHPLTTLPATREATCPSSLDILSKPTSPIMSAEIVPNQSGKQLFSFAWHVFLLNEIFAEISCQLLHVSFCFMITFFQLFHCTCIIKHILSCTCIVDIIVLFPRDNLLLQHSLI